KNQRLRPCCRPERPRTQGITNVSASPYGHACERRHISCLSSARNNRCRLTRSTTPAALRHLSGGCQMNRKGFTLIELLIVVVIIGILAAIAIPKFANTKEKAYLASMKSDLRNLITAEEAYFADSVKYTSN